MCGAPVTVLEVMVSIPTWADKKTFAVVGNVLTTSVSAVLSKDSGSIILKTIQSHEQPNNIYVQTLYMLELDLGPFPIGSAHLFPNEQ